MAVRSDHSLALLEHQVGTWFRLRIGLNWYRPVWRWLRKKNLGARLLIFRLSLIRYVNITATRSPLIMSRRSLRPPRFSERCWLDRPDIRRYGKKEKRTLDIRGAYIRNLYANLLIGSITLTYSFIYLCAVRGMQMPHRRRRKPNLDKTEIQIRSVRDPTVKAAVEFRLKF